MREMEEDQSSVIVLSHELIKCTLYVLVQRGI